MSEIPQRTVVFYASQSGWPTLDQGEGGGNPFASALIELLEAPELDFSELKAKLVALTQDKSTGFQVPQAVPEDPTIEWVVKPIPVAESRVALVAVYADYSLARVNSLPGAARDAARVASALEAAGFEVQTLVDPSRASLLAALEELSTRSVSAEAALIYMTGHGLERGGQVYLIPSNQLFTETIAKLPEVAVHVPGLTTYLKAGSANLVFFGGCRSYE